MTHAELLAFIEKIAALGICADEDGTCYSDSGPYCGAHMGKYDIEAEILEARRIVKATKDQQQQVSASPNQG